ncbi:hypothetical protein AKJ08_2444 [Vulgatibacter incomptus]|uniref:Uncharacterized protein n=1 Tax=Vulgatibacter incomptus TaxID=1391653 RepID=A0A0K1PEX5_9BACT|nr:hypothetical protein AKJ08_2444 [Vulgatibacter incomptus]
MPGASRGAIREGHPLFALGWVLLATGDLVFGPILPGSTVQLGMPGDVPIQWIEPAEGIGWALEVEGSLVSSGNDQLVLEHGFGEPSTVLFVTPDTTYMLDGRAVTFNELPAGGEVRATYDLEGDRRVVTRVDAMPPGQGPPPPNAAEPIIPRVVGGKLEQGLPPATSPSAPPEEKPRKLE